MKRLAKYIILLSIGLLTLSCWNPFSPDEENPDDNTPPADRTSAANCLEYMRQAYTNLDSKKYFECLADDFIFYLLPDDFFYDGDKYITHWAKTTEEDVTMSLFSNMSSITLDFSADPDGHDEQQNGETLRVFNKGFRLSAYLKYSQGDVQGYTANGTATFKLRQNASSKLWEIVEWSDGSDVSSIQMNSQPVKNTLKNSSYIGWKVKSMQDDTK